MTEETFTLHDMLGVYWRGKPMSDKNWFIYACVGEHTQAAPKLMTYANGTLLAMRNGDGDRVATILEHSLSTEEIRNRIAQLFKVKAGNQPTAETLEKLKS